MDKKNLKLILDEGGYIDYRNVFRDLEKENLEGLDVEGLDWDEADSESELPDWIKNKWKKYDMKDWDK